MFDNSTVFSFCAVTALLGGQIRAEPAPVPVTVFIHGTSLVGGQLVYSNDGLNALDTLSSIDPAYRFGTVLCQVDPHDFPSQHYYSFGWGGDLSHQVRVYAAGELSRALLKLQDRYRQQGRKIKITLITHSHGGAVALLLGQVYAQLSPKQKQQLVIDRLIMLACPVQVVTQNLVQHEIFKQVYVFYSKLDFIQVAAPQISEFGKQLGQGQIPGSARIFPLHLKVKQVEISAGWRPGIGHLEFIFQSFARRLPQLLKRVDWHAARPTANFLRGQFNIDLHKV